MGHENRSQTNRRYGSNPVATEVRDARERAGHTIEQAAELIFTAPKTWREWEKEESDRRRMHPAFFQLYLILTGQKSVDDIMDERALAKLKRG